MKYEKKSLAAAQNRYLNFIALGPTSVYDIYDIIKREVDVKNIRKVVKRLFSLGLIEVEGVYARKEIKYRLTSKGLFHYLSESMTIPFMLLPDYKDNIILETILLELFESSTVSDFATVPRVALLGTYIQNCCKKITDTVEYFRHSKFADKTTYLSNDIERIIRNEMRNFVFQIITNSNMKLEDIQFSAGSKRKDKTIESNRFSLKITENGDPLDEYVYPIFALAKDKKFTKLVQEVKKDFDEGCRELLYFPL